MPDEKKVDKPKKKRKPKAKPEEKKPMTDAPAKAM
jgi:hypothetical protein